MNLRLLHAFRRLAPWAAMLAVLTFLAACVQVESPSVMRGTITGTLSYGPTSADVDLGSTEAVSSSGGRIAVTDGRQDFELSPAGRNAEFVLGEIIVKFRETEDAPQMSPQSTLRAAGVSLARLRTLSIERSGLYRSAAADRASTLAAIDALNARPDVEYAHPNYVMEAFVQPSDEFYPLMWHYTFVGLEEAWDVTTGSSSTVVAVLDTGMLFGHPDAPVNLLGGYDFVSDPTNLDGDGRDSDPTDPGPADQTGYHGTHVTGTVAAAANNNYDADASADGIAGVSWTTTVLPVRVLGPSGTIADISDAIIWSSGGSVSGVPTNANPADVINLSLGGGMACSQSTLLQDAVNQAVTRGATVVAAAGNGGQDGIGDDAANTSPASCNNVFTVGAWTLADDRAPYSNWGDVLELMAPGGLSTEDENSDGQPDGVLSLGFDDSSSTYTYVWSTGTSMATPHVSGVIALMLAAKPELTRTEIRDILMNTATPYTSTQCDAGQGISSPSTACGAGILDARTAVETAAGTTPPANGELAFSPESVSLGSDASSATVTLTNTGTSNLSWQIVGARGDPENPEPIGDDVLGADPLSDTLSAGASQNLLVQIERANVTTPGAYAAYYLFDTDGDTSTIETELPVTFIIPDEALTEATGPSLVEALLTTTWERSGGQSSAGAILDYSFSATPGPNYVYGWSDEDEDGVISAGDWYGDYPTTVRVDSGERVTGIDFKLTQVATRQEIAASLPEGVTLEDIEQAR